MAHVQGYVAEASEEEMERIPELSLGDTLGKQGLEQVLEDRLRGVKGRRQLEVDATGRALNEVVLEKPEAGEDISLSIDLDIQKLAREQLRGKAGAVVVMDPDNGEVLAFVSSPSYNSNAFTTGLSNEQWSALRDDPMHPMTNRVIQSVYPPGSVFKLVVASCALVNGVDPEETFYCPGHLKFGRRVFNCWKKGGHGRVDMRKGLIESCDVYFYKIGDRLGVDRISEFAEDCGFNAPTGVDLPHEKSGLIPTREWKLKRYNERWQGGENLNLAIGQGYTLASPLQVARFVAAVANGGTLYKPLLLAGEKPVVQGRLPMPEEDLDFVRETMIDTVEVQGGTARRLRKREATIGAKTGTAQVVKLMEKFEELDVDEIPYRFRDHAWMASFGEKDGRRYVVVCVVEHGGHGSSGAGPVVRAVYDYLFGDYMAEGEGRIGGES
jgi:penicillin-binding protein 2